MKPSFDTVEETETFVRAAFAEEPARLAHILSVADHVRTSAMSISKTHPEIGLDVNEAYRAALLHDIGYIDQANEIGFHPVDGAEFLKSCGYPRLAELIVCHSNSPEQAKLRQLGTVPISDDLVAKLVTYWDVQIKQGGEQVSYADRFRDIIERYGEDSVVSRSHILARPRIERLMEEIRALLLS